MKTTEKTFIIEVEKALDWEAGYLTHTNGVTSDVKYAASFDNEEDAQDAAATFNITYGRNGRIYARVR